MTENAQKPVLLWKNAIEACKELLSITDEEYLTSEHWLEFRKLWPNRGAFLEELRPVRNYLAAYS